MIQFSVFSEREKNVHMECNRTVDLFIAFILAVIWWIHIQYDAMQWLRWLRCNRNQKSRTEPERIEYIDKRNNEKCMGTK